MAALKLLVVEDDVASLELMAEVLVSLKADVRPIADSQKAAILVNEEMFDAIFLDLQMPNINGFELAQAIRNSSRNKSTPIVVVTAREQQDTMYRSFAVGATFFLQKPIDREKVIDLFHTVETPLYESRRHYTRVPLDTEVMCSVGPRKLSGRAWNLSQGGIQVGVQDLRQGDTVRLSFRLSQSTKIQDVPGVVVWEQEERQGIQFTSMSLKSQEDIRNFVIRPELSPK